MPPSPHCTLASPLAFLWLTKAFQKLPLRPQYLPHPHGRGSLIHLSVPWASHPARELCLSYTSDWIISLSFQKCSMAPLFCWINYKCLRPESKTLYNMAPIYLLGLSLSTLWLKLYVPGKLNILYFLPFSSIFCPPGYCYYFSLSGAYASM